jgi:WD40 repeat protein
VESIRTIGPHPDSVYDIALAPDETRLATACRDGAVRFWTWPDGELEGGINTGGAGVTSVRFSPDGKQVAMGSPSGAAVAPIASTGTDGLVVLSNESVEAVAFSPAGDRVYVADSAGRLTAWESETGEYIAGLELGSDRLPSVETSADGSTVFVGNADGVVWIIDSASWDATSVEFGAGAHVYRAVCGPDGDLLAASFQLDGAGDIGDSLSPHRYEISIWRRSDPGGPRGDRTLVGHAGWIGALAFDPTGGLLASGSFDECVKVWDPIAHQLVDQAREHEGAAYAVTWASNGELLSASADGTVKVWRPGDGHPAPITREVEPLTKAWLLTTMLDTIGPGRAPLVRVAQDIVDAMVATGSLKRVEDIVRTVGSDLDPALLRVWNAVIWVIQLRLEQAYRSGDVNTAKAFNTLGNRISQAMFGGPS